MAPARLASRYLDPRDKTDAIHLAWDANGDVSDSWGLSALPIRCPYRVGQWVRLHGYPGAMPGHGQIGFRGFVLGYMGGSQLRGLTDDGREWFCNWGWLDPDDGRSDKASMRCTCCPHLPVVRKPEQLSIFDVAVAA